MPFPFHCRPLIQSVHLHKNNDPITTQPPQNTTTYKSYLSRADRIARREDLSLILPGVQAVVCTMTLYWPGKKGFPTPFAPAAVGGEGKEAAKEEGAEIRAARARGVVSCYSWCVCRAATTCVCVVYAPLPAYHASNYTHTRR